jgi:NitT/TauT family transport system permease protein
MSARQWQGWRWALGAASTVCVFAAANAETRVDTATVFSGLLTVILIGLFVESIIFRAIEPRTVSMWGMQR